MGLCSKFLKTWRNCGPLIAPASHLTIGELGLVHLQGKIAELGGHLAAAAFSRAQAIRQTCSDHRNSLEY